MGRPRIDKDKKAVNFSICLPPEVLEQVDQKRGDTTRSAFIHNAIKSSGIIWEKIRDTQAVPSANKEPPKGYGVRKWNVLHVIRLAILNLEPMQ